MNELARLVVPALRWDETHGFRYLDGLIEDSLELGVGGFMIEGGPRDAVAALIARLHPESRHPLLVAVQAERGAGETIVGCTQLPPFGAVGSAALVHPDGQVAPALEAETIRRAARITARELRSLGANWALAPVCDVDAPDGDGTACSRAADADPAVVAAIAAEWVDACQADAVIACARHFPGEGGLPSRAGLRSSDGTAPFAAAVDAGVASVMVSLRATRVAGASGPAAASSAVVRDLLRGRLGFEGVVATAPLDRDDAIAPAQEPALAAAAVAAGCDVVLAPGDLHGTCDALARAARDGVISAPRTHEAIARVERWAGWGRPSPVREPTLDDLLWARQLADRATRYVRGSRPRVGGAVEVVAIAAASPRANPDPFAAVLRSAHVEVAESAAPTQGRREPLVILAMPGDECCGSVRADESAAVASAVRAGVAAGRDVAVIACCHPRGAAALAAAVHGDAAVVCAWDASRTMLEAAARAVITVR